MCLLEGLCMALAGTRCRSRALSLTHALTLSNAAGKGGYNQGPQHRMWMQYLAFEKSNPQVRGVTGHTVITQSLVTQPLATHQSHFHSSESEY
jgi:hypothetical protein